MPLGIKNKVSGEFYYGPKQWGPDKDRARTFVSTVVPASHLMDITEARAKAEGVPEEQWPQYHQDKKNEYELVELATEAAH